MNKGYWRPNLTVHPEHDLSSAQAREYAVDLESLYEYLHTKVATAQQHYQGPADTKHLAPPVIAQAGSLSFTICLPDSMCAVHPVFHVSQLKLATPNIIPNHVQPPPPPVEVDGEPKYKIAVYVF